MLRVVSRVAAVLCWPVLSRRPLYPIVALGLALTCLPSARAWAQSEDDGVSSGSDAAELESLQQQLDETLAELSTADCAIACRALQSMTRAADRICVLDSGPPCQDARAKVADANRRVREACPDCAVATEPAEREKRATTKTTEAAPGPMKSGPMKEGGGADDDEEAPAPGAAPEPLDSQAGGCASCTVGERRVNDRPAWLLMVLGLVAVARRATSRKPRPSQRRRKRTD